MNQSLSITSKNLDALRNANLRLCRLRRWSNYNGFGFIVESLPEPLHIIQLVEPYSPANAAGLQIFDIVLAVNNQDISKDDYEHVTKTIEYAINRNDIIELLVIEQRYYQSLKKKNIKIDKNYAHVIDGPQVMPIDYENYLKYQPRTCIIYLNEFDKTFGFDVSDNKNKIGVYVEEIYPNTPASKTSLRKYDRIIEINDEFIDENTSKSIFKKLDKAKQKRNVKLYVVDMETYEYFQRNEIPLASKKYRKTQIDNELSTTNQNYINNYQNSNVSSHDNRQSLSVTEDIRLCTIIRANVTDSLGFSLNYNKERIHSLAIVPQHNDETSNAKLSGINDHDCLIEINGENIESLNHAQTVQRIGDIKYPAPLQILVADTVTYNYYKQQKKLIHHDLSIVKVMPPNMHRRSLSCAKSEFDYDNNNTFDDKKYSIRPSTSIKNTKPSIYICKGDLITQQTDVIVVCSSSKYLFDSICNAGGTSVLNSYNTKLNTQRIDSIITVKSDGRIASKQIFFIPCKLNSDTNILRKTIKTFVSNAIREAAYENYQSIAFPAIGCGKCGYSTSFIAETMIKEADRQLSIYSISVLFVIEPERIDIYDEFQKQIYLLQSEGVEQISTTIGKGTIEVIEGDITMEMVDVIISCSSSKTLTESIIKAAGNETQIAFNNEYSKNPNSILIATPSGDLNCKQIFFLNWQPDIDEEKLQQSLIDLISTVIQNVISYKFNSIAFPAIGCGKHGCSIHIVVQTMIKELKTQLNKRNLPWIIKFVIQPDQPNIYDEFRKQILTTHDDSMELQDYKIPSTWEKSSEDKKRFVLSIKSNEYRTIVSDFDQTMKQKYTQIIQIERIQNERCYMQYLVHSRDFKKRLNTDTEKRLYHGCSEDAANSIIEDCFNRSFAGKNGTAYGVGVYFSSNASYSHGYTRINTNGERCMFIARVLVGKTTTGNSTMKVRPVGYDSTTDNNHIFVTYHDAQVYADYLITYK